MTKKEIKTKRIKLSRSAISNPLKIGKGKKIKKVRGTKQTYDGIEFKSSLEVFCYKQLVKSKLKFKYEPHSFLIKDKDERKFNVWKKTPKKPMHHIVSRTVQKISFTPDFIIYDENDNIIEIIETKGRPSEKFVVYVKIFYTWANSNLPYLNNYFLPSNQKEVNRVIELLTGKQY